MAKHETSRIPQHFEPNSFSKLLEEQRRAPTRLWDLTITNPTEVNLPYPDLLLAKAYAGTTNRPYEPDPRGILSAREALANTLSMEGKQVAPEDLWITSGSSEAYSFLIKACTEPGDAFLVPSPSYPLFEGLLHLEGVQGIPYELTWDDRWNVNLDSLRATDTSNSRAMIVVNPNNPTGSYLSRAEWEEITAFCAQENLVLISDEVFFPYALHSEVSKTSLNDLETDCVRITLDGLSKAYGLPQMKLSWMAIHGPEGKVEILKQKLEWISDLYLTTNTPVQHALPKLLQLGGEIRDTISSRLQENLEIWRKDLTGSADVSMLDPEGGWTLLLQLADKHNEEELALSLLREENIVVHPGYFFDLPFNSSLVVSLLVDPEVTNKGLLALQKLTQE